MTTSGSAESGSADALVWLNCGGDGGPWPAFLAAPGRAVVKCPTALMADPPADLEVVVPGAQAFVTRPVRSVTLVADVPPGYFGDEGEEVVATVAFEPDERLPSGDLFEVLLRLYAVEGDVKETADPLGDIQPPDGFDRLRTPPLGSGVAVVDIRRGSSPTDFSIACALMPWKW